MGRFSTLRWVTAMSAVVLLGVGTVWATALPAAAADPAALEVNKLVDGGKSATLAPGDEFTFTIRLGCDDADCVDARIEDTLPAELAGFEIVGFSASPPNPAPPAAPAWVVSSTGCEGTPPSVVTTDPPCTGAVQFVEPLADGSTGLAAGQAYTLTITLRVPQDLPPTWPYNGQTITNTGTGTADNATTSTSSASVVVEVPTTVDVETTKSWTPTTERYSPGADSTIALSASNTSNTPADSIVLQDPADAPDGATALSDTNPFRFVDAAGPGTVTPPAGATAVQVDAYVLDPATGTYRWVPGSPAPPGSAALPPGVTDDQVAGLRYTFTAEDGAVLTPGDPPATVQLDVTQRATDRDTDAALDGGWTRTNTSSATVAVPGQDPVSDDASADHTVTPTSLAASLTKSIDPARVPAGASAVGTLTATNGSDGPVQQLTVSDLDYFTADVAFAGFTAPLVYPATASGARITWHFSDGTTRTDAFTDGSTPSVTPPDGTWVTGFSIDYDGPIDAGSSVTVPFRIDTSADAVTGDGPLATTNTARTTVTNGDASASDSAVARLDVFEPDIDIALDKSLSPQEPIAPGGTVVAQLPATTSTDSAFVTPTTITVEDVAPTPHDDASFWNAFDPVAIAPTQVPDGATLTIEYTTDDGATWQALPLDGLPATGPTTFSGTIPAALQGTITGLRFVFSDPDGFPQGTSVQPNVVAQARADQRYGGDPTSTPDAGPTSYTNRATAQGEGSVAGGTTITSDVVDAEADAAIETTSGDGSVIAGKRWTDTDFTTDRTTVDSQSGETVGSVLEWGARATGTDSITVTDPAGDPDDPADTAFQAFDLRAVAPVPLGSDGLWRWDTVSSVELFADGAWSTVPAPAGGWVDDSGFVGYTLTAGESAATTGIRITVVPDDAARTASTDPTRPVPGSGIATSTTPRDFDLTWRLRNELRDPSSADSRWVNGSTEYNLTAPGSIRNAVDVTGETADGDTTATAQDDLVILDRPPLVSVDKRSEHDVLPVPARGDVPAADYPTNDVTVTAANESASRASYVRVTDPMPCTPSTVAACTSEADDWAADPFADAAFGPANPFERFTLTGLDFSFDTAQVDADASVVTLLHRAADGTLRTSTTTASGARAATADALADVIGVSVVYQGADPATTGGTISAGSPLVMTMHTQLRTTLRSLPAVPVTATTVTNRAFSQSYDPVLAPSEQTSTPTDTASADVRLARGVLDVDATKTITPDRLLEAGRDDPVDVALGASQGDDATVAPNSVTIADVDPAFWDDVRLAAFSPADVTFPAGADRVRVDVRLDGSDDWLLGTASSAASLPTSELAAVTGIRFVFDRADGDVLSHTTPPTPWTAEAVLHVRLLATARDGGAVAFPGTVSDTSDVTAHRTDDTLFPDATATADDDLVLDPGTHVLDVAKAPRNDQHTVAVGSPVPWTITMRNTGTGIITLSSVRDELPALLTWDGSDPTFATSGGGTLSTDVRTVADDAGRTVTFTWPDDGDRMSPDEVFTITIPLVLQPGLQEGERATNEVVAVTGDDLDGCTNTSGNGQGVLTGLDTTECGTSNFVQPTPGPALLTTKAVRGDVVDPIVSGATDPSCLPDDDGFFLPPCTARTRVGGTDEWRLRARNTGTVNQDTVTFVDALPRPGDVLLATGSARGSTYRPVLDGDFGVRVQAPDGATSVWQVTTDADVCATPAGTTWPADTTCDGNDWTDGSAYTGDWAAVTGIRVVVDVRTPGGVGPGGTVTADYRTTNTPASDAHADGVPAAVPLGDQVAYDQVGTTVTLANGALPIAQAPVKVGVAPSAGPLLVRKELTGPGASDAPDRFDADVRCTVAGVDVDMGDDASVALTRDGGLEARVDGIPVGASCVVTEQGPLGSHGEIARSVTPGTVTVLTPGTADDVVPTTQVVTITNTYAIAPTPPSPAPPTPTPPSPTPTPTPAPPVPGDPGGAGGAAAGPGTGLAFTGVDGGALVSLLVVTGLLLGSGLLLRLRARRARA